MRKADKKTLVELQRLVETDTPAKLKPFLEAGVSVNQRIGDGLPMTLLEFAVEKNAVEVVRFLIGADADLNKGNHKPLIHAAAFNRVEIVRLLLAAGADPNVTHANPDESQRGLTALMYAVDLPEKIEIVELLLKHGADPKLATNKGNTAIGDAISHGNLRAVRILLEAGCRPQGPALLAPIYRGDAELLELILSSGADVQSLGNKNTHFLGCTPLEAAVGMHADKTDLIRTLEKRRLEPFERAALERCRNEAQTALRMIRALTRATASVNQTLLLSPLFRAAAAGDLEVVKLLLETGVDPNRATGRLTFERTALNAATAGGFAETVEALKAAGAK